MAAALGQQKCSCLLQQSNRTLQRAVIRPVELGSSSGVASRRNVQVHAKGKGAAKRMAPGQMQQQMVRPKLPPVDPDNEEFCVFMRATSGVYQNWIFVSVVKGGASANALVKSMESAWGKKLYSRTLIQNIGNAVYKDRDTIVKGLKREIQQQLNGNPQAKVMEPIIKQPVTNFEFAFKIRDKSKPGEYQKADGLTLVPKESELVQMPLDKFKAFFSPENLGSLFSGSS
eukprot:GHUV01001975.1.p1 GENE.GHUV01001975.1~~GHUV01001975.1.p1  ORF type:complete len:229 (+),score=77.60 GHUV01001975.1:95-781(+)